MAHERISGSPENEPPGRYVDLYTLRLDTQGVTRADLSIALQNLVMQELEVDDAAALALIYKSGFPDKIMELECYDEDEIGRTEAELFSMAPLLLLWPAIRDTRSPEESLAWLDSAAALALTEAEFHDGENCSTVAGMPISDECEYGDMCPPKTTLRLLLQKALETPDTLDVLIVDPAEELMMIRAEVRVALKSKLITPDQQKAVIRHYVQQRSLQVKEEEITE